MHFWKNSGPQKNSGFRHNSGIFSENSGIFSENSDIFLKKCKFCGIKNLGYKIKFSKTQIKSAKPQLFGILKSNSEAEVCTKKACISRKLRQRYVKGL